MEGKPRAAAGYSPATVKFVYAASLYIATKLGDLRDDVVIVGGLVPSLIIPQVGLPAGKHPHVGTMDVDLGLAVAILDQQRYHKLCERLRQAGFEQDINEAGQLANQRWRIESESRTVMVDFLIPPTLESDKGGRLRNLEERFCSHHNSRAGIGIRRQATRDARRSNFASRANKSRGMGVRGRSVHDT